MNLTGSRQGWRRLSPGDFPLAKVVRGPGLHMTAEGVEQKLIDCSAADDTPEAGFENKARCTPEM